jgi:peptide/nickel transport system ATP-binding protein/oligopeptide transport system ATP-binding protein
MRAVDGVSFSMKQGRTLGLVGESGSGKSVTALSVMRLIDDPGRIQEGSRITFMDTDLAGATEDELEQLRGNQMAMIFQEPMTSLNPVYTIGHQVGEALRLHRGLHGRKAQERAIDLLRQVGIPLAEERIHQFPHQLSGGMRQRVMIAMALACDPLLLIADEPTTALDVTIQAQILALMHELRQRRNTAILLITHDLGVIAEMADDVAVMYAGRIVEQGTVEQVFRSPQHPYTEALLQSLPVLGMTQAEPLRVIRGMVPSPLRWPQGCRFAPRCDYRFDKCAKYPPLFDVPPSGSSSASGGGSEQRSACWLCESGRRQAVGQTARI